MANRFPLAMMLLTPACDLVRLVTGDARWAHAGYYLAFTGTVAAAVLALPAAVDWLATARGARGWATAGAAVLLAAVAVATATTGVLWRLAEGAGTFARGPFTLALASA